MYEDMLSPWMGECDSNQVSWWSSGYDAHPDQLLTARFDTAIEAQILASGSEKRPSLQGR